MLPVLSEDCLNAASMKFYINLMILLLFACRFFRSTKKLRILMISTGHYVRKRYLFSTWLVNDGTLSCSEFLF